MGVDATASNESNPADQSALERDLETHGLHSNLRKCKMRAWKSTFTACTGEDVFDLEWSTASPPTVMRWALSAEEQKNKNNTADDEAMRVYLSVCETQGVHCV
jgi:hypothetical protein